jgi:hypothetical protein
LEKEGKMTTLFQAMLETARVVGGLKSGTASATGTTTTLIDTNRYEQADYYNSGTLFLHAHTDSTLTTRTYFTKVITDYALSTGTFTFGTGFGTAIASAERYSVTNIHKESLIQAINSALTYMGDYTAIDETLDVTDNATEYTLPSGVSNVKRIEAYTTASAPYGFTPIMTWREFGGKIYLPYEMNHTKGNTLRVYYNKFHADVDTDEDTILDIYNLKRLAWTAAYMFMFNRMQYSGNADSKENDMLAIFSQQAQRLANAFPVSKIERDANLARY